MVDDLAEGPRYLSCQSQLYSNISVFPYLLPIRSRRRCCRRRQIVV